MILKRVEGVLKMYSSKLIEMMNNDAEKIGNEIDETIHVTANEMADDVKIYIRHNSGEIIKDFYEQYKIEKELRKISL